jgi:iron-sulfur cluster insertion protein
MSETTVFVKPSIVVTPAAAMKVKALIDEEQNANLNLRAYVTGGGCSGLQYGFKFEEQGEAANTDEADVMGEDTIIDTPIADGFIRLVVDPMSIQYLNGAEIDYTSDVEEKFVIRNPNAQTTCGCGSSFAVEE